RHAPCLCGSAPGHVRFIAVEYLGNAPKAGIVHMIHERLDEPPRHFCIGRFPAEGPGESRYEMADQPRPHGSLVVSRIPPEHVADVAAPVSFRIPGKGPEAIWSV